jgi:hypothetical protein
MTTPFSAFGPGKVIVTRTDVANGTPVNIGFSQDFEVDFSGTIKELTGQNQYPIDVARGVAKVTGKMTAAVISGIAWNSVFFGNTFVPGGYQMNDLEPHSIPAITPFTIVVMNGATFDKSVAGGDLGVIYAGSGLPFQKVATAPTVGQYTVDPTTGSYAFSLADEGVAILISYRSTVTTGQTLTIANKLLGNTPVFQLDYYTVRNNAPFLVRLFQCTGSKVSMAAKLEDFMMPAFEFSSFVNAAGNIGEFIYPQVS